jgi:beta-lactamase regulating signal transducer with metallopeptidase domain
MIDSTWIELILELTIKTVLVLGIAFAILFVGKRISFATRHLILTFAIASILFLPLISHILPSWDLSLFPSFWPQETQPANQVQVSQLDPTINVTNIQLISGFPSYPIETSRTNPIDWPTWIFIGWLIGATAVSMRLIAGSIGIKLLTCRTNRVEDPAFLSLLRTHSKKLGIKRKVLLYQTPKASVPSTFGWLHPTILLPTGASDWTEKRKTIVLLHELAHIKRGDFLLSFVTRLSSILYWFNPMVWIAIRQLAVEREHASDDCVLAAGTKASEYAGHLLDIARKASSLRWSSPAGITIAKKSNLEARIMFILNNKKASGQIKLSTVLLMGLLTISLILPIASVHSWAQNEISQEKEQEKTVGSTEIPDKEEIKKALKQFFEYIEKLDFSKALTFFADEPEIEITEDTPLVIVHSGKKSGEKNIQIYKVDDLKNIQIKTNIKTIAKDYATVKINGKIAIIGTDKADVKHILLRKDGDHTIIMKNKDGKWKLYADALQLNFIKDDIDKESKKVALCFTDEGVTYTIIRVSPSITVVKQEKKKEEKKR